MRPMRRLWSRARDAWHALPRLRTIPRGSRRPLLRLWTVQIIRRPLTGRGLVRRLMHDSRTRSRSQHTAPNPEANGAVAPASAPGTQAAPPGESSAPSEPPRLLILVRHGQATYNVENRMPGQIAGVALTDEGRRQALRAAVALSGLPLSAVISSPLERANDTARIIARGWNLPVRTDPRLMDTDVGPWAGQLIADLRQNDPGWEQYVSHPNAPPPGVESFEQVQRRAMAAVRDLLADETLGSYIVLVSHADVVKLILAHYGGVASESARFINIANASLSALAFGDAPHPHVLAINWTALPAWLSPPSKTQASQTQRAAETDEARTVGDQPQPQLQHEELASSETGETLETSEDADVRPT